MGALGNRVSIGPIARRGKDRSAEIRRHIGLEATTPLVLLSLGGVPFRIDVSRWPRLHGTHVVAAMDIDGLHSDVTPARSLGIAHIDLLASSAVVITKPGYGTVAEAAVNGVPVLYVTRDGWPEEPYLVRWLERHGRCDELPRVSLMEGSLLEAVQRISARPAPQPSEPDGVEAGARLLLERL
jgi:UDP:flavonoid glycosyltransferase YjiC (YdhE family)